MKGLDENHKIVKNVFHILKSTALRLIITYMTLEQAELNGPC